MIFSGCNDEVPDNNVNEKSKITISGEITNTPHEVNPATEIVARNTSGVLLGEDKTNSEGQYALTFGDEVDSFKLTYKSSNHESRDTTLTAWRNHTIDQELQVKPVSVDASYKLDVSNTSGSKVGDAVVELYANPSKSNELINNGKTNSEGVYSTSFDQVEWIFKEDTIRKINDVKTSIDAYDWYESRQANLDDDFIEELEKYLT